MYCGSYVIKLKLNGGILSDPNRNRADMAFQAGRRSNVHPGNAEPIERDPSHRENQPRGGSDGLVLSTCLESDREVVSLF
jgi:hypothetical protein